MIRHATRGDIAALLSLAEATGLFDSSDIEGFGEMMKEQLSGNQHDESYWIVDSEDDILGAAYYAPETFTEGVWNLYFIGVHPTQQGKGRGSALLNYVEQSLVTKGERLLLVETSGVDSFELTRSFYQKNGYTEEARIRDFYKPGDDKVVFRKALSQVNP